MELQHLRTFLAVADAGSLTRAAESLYLSQPAVSAQVKALELELGLPLFRRAARGMELTAGGDELLERARDVVHRADGIARLAERLRGDVSGLLRLGTTDCGYDLKLARMIGRTTQDHPELDVQLVTGNSGQHVRSVLDETLDLAFVEGDHDDGRLQSWRSRRPSSRWRTPASWGQRRTRRSARSTRRCSDTGSPRRPSSRWGGPSARWLVHYLPRKPTLVCWCRRSAFFSTSWMLARDEARAGASARLRHRRRIVVFNVLFHLLYARGKHAPRRQRVRRIPRGTRAGKPGALTPQQPRRLVDVLIPAARSS